MDDCILNDETYEKMNSEYEKALGGDIKAFYGTPPFSLVKKERTNEPVTLQQKASESAEKVEVIIKTEDFTSIPPIIKYLTKHASTGYDTVPRILMHALQKLNAFYNEKAKTQVLANEVPSPYDAYVTSVELAEKHPELIYVPLAVSLTLK